MNRGKENCNMAAYNWCMHKSGCFTGNDIDNRPDPVWINTWEKGCTEPNHHLVHDKCQKTQGKFCLVVKDNKLEHVSKPRGGCTELHQKDLQSDAFPISSVLLQDADCDNF